MKTIAMRFAAVGVLNTVVDFAVFAVLAGAGTPLLLANVVSTSAGLAFSFFANRRFTFRSSTSGRQTLLFFVVTGCGLWIVQPAIILATAPLFEPFAGAALAPSAAKVLAIACTALCNFLIYSKAVFRNRPAAPVAPSTPLPGA